MITEKKFFNFNAQDSLPFSYDENKIVLLPQNPNTIFLYWDFQENTFLNICQNQFRIVVRLYNEEFCNYQYIEVNYDQRDHYYNLEGIALKKDSLIAELGYLDHNNNFILLAKSRREKFFGNQELPVVETASSSF